MLPNLTLCKVDNSWDELPDDMRRIVLNMRKSRPMSVRIHLWWKAQPWFITARLFEEGVEPQLREAWELTYDGSERLLRFADTNPTSEFYQDDEKGGFSQLTFSVPDTSQAAKRISEKLDSEKFKPRRFSSYSYEYLMRVHRRAGLALHHPSLGKWHLTVPLADHSRDADLMAELIGKSAPEAFNRLFTAVRKKYVEYSLPSYKDGSGESPEELRKRILENLDKFAQMVHDFHTGSFTFDDMARKWNMELRDYKEPKRKPRPSYQTQRRSRPLLGRF